MIVIIDYDMGNVASIKNMFHKIGFDGIIISYDHKDIIGADKLILPGVGAFDQGMKNLTESGLDSVIKEAVLEKGKPIMGICLGMQLLGRSSEEGSRKGLGLLPFDSVRFKADSDIKIPHMGWNEVSIRKSIPITSGMTEELQRFYFVHSYHAVCDNEDNILMTCNYGYEFTAAVCGGNVLGFQFHPEKSHRYGMKVFENYIRV